MSNRPLSEEEVSAVAEKVAAFLARDHGIVGVTGHVASILETAVQETRDRILALERERNEAATIEFQKWHEEIRAAGPDVPPIDPREHRLQALLVALSDVLEHDDRELARAGMLDSLITAKMMTETLITRKEPDDRPF